MRKTDPVSLTLDCWSLGMEAWSVVGMRVPRLMTGDPAALVEAQRMVTEKVEAAALLQWKMMTGGLGGSVPAMLGGSVAHYRAAVRKNRRRLGSGKRR
ncbi:hypothetical protein [Sphingobium ummariense]